MSGLGCRVSGLGVSGLVVCGLRDTVFLCGVDKGFDGFFRVKVWEQYSFVAPLQGSTRV